MRKYRNNNKIDTDKSVDLEVKKDVINNKLEYYKLLEHPKWQRKRLEIMQRDNFKCRLCQDEETTLNVHHKKYKPNKKPWEYSDEELITLCKFCHIVYGNHSKFDILSGISFRNDNYILRIIKSPITDIHIIISSLSSESNNNIIVNYKKRERLIAFLNG